MLVSSRTTLIDQFIDTGFRYLDQISWTRDWIGYYNCDPRGFNGSTLQKKLVLGGEAALWGEYMDATNFEARAWFVFAQF